MKAMHLVKSGQKIALQNIAFCFAGYVTKVKARSGYAQDMNMCIWAAENSISRKSKGSKKLNRISQTSLFFSALATASERECT